MWQGENRFSVAPSYCVLTRFVAEKRMKIERLLKDNSSQFKRSVFCVAWLLYPRCKCKLEITALKTRYTQEAIWPWGYNLTVAIVWLARGTSCSDWRGELIKASSLPIQIYVFINGFHYSWVFPGMTSLKRSVETSLRSIILTEHAPEPEFK